MLEKIQYFIAYGQAVANYAQKVFSIVSVASKSWPKWVPPTEKEESPSRELVETE